MRCKKEELEGDLTELCQESSHVVQDLKHLHVEKLRQQSKFQEKIAKLEAEKQHLQKRASNLSAAVRNHGVGPLRGSSLKALDEYSDSHRRRLKRARAENCGDSLRWLQHEGYAPLSVKVQSTKTGKTEFIDLRNEDVEDVFGSGDVSDNHVDTLNMMLFVKDWYNVSHSAYHEFAKICKQMPRQYKIGDRIKELNKLWNIRATPNGTVGVQQSLEDRLHTRVKRLIKTSPPNAPFLQDRQLKVKLSGDGTNIGKRLHVVGFTFTLLDENQACSSEGNHLLAVFKEPESYDSLKQALEDIIYEVEHLDAIEVDGVSYSIEYYMGGDWKFLAMVTGIDSATSTYSCIWCKCDKEQRRDISAKWSISRTTDENTELSKLPRSRKKYNVSSSPLFPRIPLKNIVIDNLHLFLRISDVLINLLIVELRRQDCIDKVKKFTQYDPVKYKHIQGFQSFVSGLGIPGFQFYI